MSTFSGLNAAYTGLVAARAGLDVVGQNLINANTQGYTRQRISTSAAAPLAGGLFSAGARPGQGVATEGVLRLADTHLDARVRVTAAASGYSAVRSNALSELETSLREPGDNGLSTRFQEFWAAWEEVSNAPGEAASSGVLLQEASALVSGIAAGRQGAEDQWSALRSRTDSLVAELNQSALLVADLNVRIRTAVAAGNSANELMDQRSTLATTIAALTGSRTRNNGDGSIDITIGGNAIVAGGTVRPVRSAGASTDAGTATDVVRLEWEHRPGDAVVLEGGELAGALSMLAPASAGGPLAQAADFYDGLATALAEQVNTLHASGQSPDGTTGLAFFAINTANPAGSLSVLPAGADGIAAGATGAGGANGKMADAIAQLGRSSGSPDSLWAGFVTSTARMARTEFQQASAAGLSADSAAAAQLSNASVDLDEENMALLAYQHAYQGAARVMTAVDEMLDTLINRTGIVGR